MDGYDASTYGDRIAEVYDTLYGADGQLEPSEAVDFLAGLAGPGPALELGIGTGRIAIPLAQRGVDVTGIDASPAMVERLRAKPGGGHIPVVMGDFADVAVDGTFALVYVPFTTFFGLPSQEEQIRCLTNVAGRLSSGGRFVMDAFVPDVARFDRGQRTTTTEVGTDTVMIDVSRHDPLHQRIESAHLVFTDGGVRLYPVSVRYCWPAELDVMARLAGLGLVDRFEWYDRSPFDAGSTRHVSVYGAS